MTELFRGMEHPYSHWFWANSTSSLGGRWEGQGSKTHPWLYPSWWRHYVPCRPIPSTRESCRIGRWACSWEERKSMKDEALTQRPWRSKCVISGGYCGEYGVIKPASGADYTRRSRCTFDDVPRSVAVWSSHRRPDDAALEMRRSSKNFRLKLKMRGKE